MLLQDLESMKYVELQKLAKSAGIRANQKIDKLIRALTEHYDNLEETQTTNRDAEPENFTGLLTSGLKDVVTENTMLTEADKPENKSKKRRRTFELEQPTLKGDITPTIEKEQPRTRLQTSRNTTPQSETYNQPAKRPRRSTFDKNSPALQDKDSSVAESSPGTRAIINSIHGACSSAERKEKLLSAIDQKVQQKMISSPSNALKNQPSHIPRFMTFLAKKKQEGQKSVTPGNKDWNKVHKKEFSKFDSIDVYLEKKQQRKENLSSSTKKPLKKRAPARKSSARILKPVAKQPESSKIFKPTVLSTKNIAFDFSKTASNCSKTPKSKSVNTPSRKNAPASSNLKDIGSTNRATPFMFTANTSSLNTTVTSSKKPAFDLKASLARPLTWKPHVGKLQSFNIGHNDTNCNTSTTKRSNVSASSRARKVMSKDSANRTRPLRAKDIRRVAHLDRKNNQKYVDMMKRRGLMP